MGLKIRNQEFSEKINNTIWKHETAKFALHTWIYLWVLLLMFTVKYFNNLTCTKESFISPCAAHSTVMGYVTYILRVYVNNNVYLLTESVSCCCPDTIRNHGGCEVVQILTPFPSFDEKPLATYSIATNPLLTTDGDGERWRRRRRPIIKLFYFDLATLP